MSSRASDRRRSPRDYLILVAVLSLPFFVLGAFFDTVRIGALELPASAVMFVLPGMAAAFLSYREFGWAGVSRLLRRAVDYGATHRVWYLAALLIPPSIALVAYLTARGVGWIDADFEISPLVLPVVLPAALFAAACEELGWTAYATDPWQERWGAERTGVFLGICWAIWHWVPLVQAGRDWRWISGWFVGTVAARVIIVSLHNRTGRGVLAAILLHAMINVSAALTPGYDEAVIPIVIGLLTAVLAFAVVLLDRRSAASTHRPHPI